MEVRTQPEVVRHTTSRRIRRVGNLGTTPTEMTLIAEACRLVAANLAGAVASIVVRP